MSARLRVLFLCTHNSCRSQIAEAWARVLHGERIEAHSAGTIATAVNRLATKAMNEVGIDMSGHTSKTAAELLALGHRFEVVITVCDAAAEACPVFPGDARMIRRAFDDPPQLARGAATEEEAMRHYRRVRDEIRGFVDKLPAVLAGDNSKLYAQTRRCGCEPGARVRAAEGCLER